MAELNREEMRRLARLGAQARLIELKREEDAIRRAFPELFRAGTRPLGAQKPGSDAPARRRRRSRMSPAARKAVSERMRKYWAQRRKAKGAKASK